MSPKAARKKKKKKGQEKKGLVASIAGKAQDGGSEALESAKAELLSPGMTKAMMTANISDMIEAKFNSFLQKIRDKTIARHH